MEIIIEIHKGEDGRAAGTVRAANTAKERSFSGNLQFLALVETLYLDQDGTTPPIPSDQTGLTDDNTKTKKESAMTDMIWSFSPWVVFLTTVRFGGVYWAASAAGVVAIVVLTRALSLKKAHLFDYVGVIYFIGLLSLLAALHPSDIGTWGRYAQAVAHGSLCVIVFASVLVNHPFTEPYAREQAPKEIWNSPDFRAFNRKISTIWGLAFLVGTLSMVLAGSTDSRQFLLRVIVPFGALGGAYAYSHALGASQAEAHHAAAAAHHAAGAAPPAQ
jgi:hypothetical protein